MYTTYDDFYTESSTIANVGQERLLIYKREQKVYVPLNKLTSESVTITSTETYPFSNSLSETKEKIMTSKFTFFFTAIRIFTLVMTAACMPTDESEAPTTLSSHVLEGIPFLQVYNGVPVLRHAMRHLLNGGSRPPAPVVSADSL